MDILRRESVLVWQVFNFCYEIGANWALGQPPLEPWSSTCTSQRQANVPGEERRLWEACMHDRPSRNFDKFISRKDMPKKANLFIEGMEGKHKGCWLTLNTFFFVVAKDTLAYLRVKFASVVQERHADLLQPPYLAGVVLKALEHTTADISGTHQAVLDLSWKERTKGRGVMSDYPVAMQLWTTARRKHFHEHGRLWCPSQKMRLFIKIIIYLFIFFLLPVGDDSLQRNTWWQLLLCHSAPQTICTA